MGEKRRKDEDMKKGGEEPTVPASKGKGEERRRDGKQRNRVNNEGITEETRGGLVCCHGNEKKHNHKR